MKWSKLMKFCIGMVIGLAGCAHPMGRPAWYSYGGTIAPGFPNYDKSAYTHAVMVCSDPGLYDGGSCTLYLFSGIPTVENDSFKAWETDLNVMVYRVRGNVWKKESAFTLALDTSTKIPNPNFIWANFDLYTQDAQLLVSASDPLPATDYTTTLFEGDVTTVAGNYIITGPNGTEYPQTFNGAHAVIAEGALFDDYGLIRVTVDEVPVGYKIQSLMLGSYVGNRWLTDSEQKDTGGSFGVMPVLLSGETLFLSREPGTYHVKVERIERRTQIVEPEQQWETLFEGTVTTAKELPTNGYSKDIAYGDVMFSGNDCIRLTVNGESAVYTAIDITDITTGAIIGNRWLWDSVNGDNEVDDGGDYLVWTRIGMISGTEFYTRNPGTYTVKIERAL